MYIHTPAISILQSSVEQYYNTVIVIDYQLQIPLHFGSTVKTEHCEYHFNLPTQASSYNFYNIPMQFIVQPHGVYRN